MVGPNRSNSSERETTPYPSRNFRLPKRDQMAALKWVAANLRAVPAPHVALQLVTGR
jgi:hypothetical protein